MGEKATEKAERYRKQAAAVKHLGDIETDPDIKRQYIEVAESYLRLAEQMDPTISTVAGDESDSH